MNRREFVGTAIAGAVGATGLTGAVMSGDGTELKNAKNPENIHVLDKDGRPTANFQIVGTVSNESGGEEFQIEFAPKIHTNISVKLKKQLLEKSSTAHSLLRRIIASGFRREADRLCPPGKDIGLRLL